MSTVTLELGGTAYPMCFSLRALSVLCEKFGSIDGAFQAIREAGAEQKLDRLSEDYLWLAALLLDCGQRTAQLDGATSPEPPTAEELRDRLGVGDLAPLYAKIDAAIAAGCVRHVGAKPPKKEKATRGRTSP